MQPHRLLERGPVAERIAKGQVEKTQKPRPALCSELLSLTPWPAALLRRSEMAVGAAQGASIANTAAGRGVGDSSSQRGVGLGLVRLLRLPPT